MLKDLKLGDWENNREFLGFSKTEDMVLEGILWFFLVAGPVGFLEVLLVEILK